MQLALWATIIAAVATVASALFAFKALRIASLARLDGLRPYIDARKAAPPTGRFGAHGKTSAALFSLEFANVGPGSAVLGPNPFRAPSDEDVTRAELENMPVNGKAYVLYPEERALPNTLRSGESYTLTFGAGQWNEEPMPEDFRLAPMHLSDVLGRDYVTQIHIVSSTGDVLRVSPAPDAFNREGLVGRIKACRR
jgi:hypothetical protein